MSRLSVYIDGFNLYHAINDLNKPHLKWVNLWDLANSLCGDKETLNAVHYFSAYATHRPDAYARHREYVAALEHAGVTVHLAHFKKKTQQCFSCQSQWTKHEEKETDVHIAVQLVADALLDEFDRAILISADSDLGPPLKKIRAVAKNKRLMVAAPPGRFGFARDLNPKLEIRQGRIARYLLPEFVHTSSGKVVASRPTSYAPPAT